MSVSRCQLFEAGFPADVLHLNDPSCKGTIRNGRVEFYFDNNEHICGTHLLVGLCIIYSNTPSKHSYCLIKSAAGFGFDFAYSMGIEDQIYIRFEEILLCGHV